MTKPLDDDPFAATGPDRDRWDRPLIIPTKRGGVPDLKAKPVPYTRVSTFAGTLDDVGGLLKWSQWILAVGLGRNPDLAAMAGAYGPTYDDLGRSDKAALDEIIATAHDRAGGNRKAHDGTAVHSMTEPDKDPFVPERMSADVASYFAALTGYGLDVVATEQFIVNDALKVAGTFDHIYRTTRPIEFDGVTIPAGLNLIGDKKTGKIHLDSQSIQLATYANGKAYDWETGERTDLEVSTDYGILVHIPNGEGRTVMYLVDLKVGYAAAKLALAVREHRTRKDIGRPFPALPVEGAVEVVEDAAEVVEVVEVVGSGLGARLQAEAAARKAIEAADIEAVEVVEPVRDIRAEIEATEAKIRADREAAAEIAEDEAVKLTRNLLGAENMADVILAEIAATTTAEQCAAIWRKYAAPPSTWTDTHTQAVRAKYPTQTRSA